MLPSFLPKTLPPWPLSVIAGYLLRVAFFVQWLVSGYTARFTAGRWPDISMRAEIQSMGALMLFRGDVSLPELLSGQLQWAVLLGAAIGLAVSFLIPS